MLSGQRDRFTEGALCGSQVPVLWFGEALSGVAGAGLTRGA